MSTYNQGCAKIIIKWILLINIYIISLGVGIIFGWYGLELKLYLYQGSFYDNPYYDCIEILFTFGLLNSCGSILSYTLLRMLAIKMIRTSTKKEEKK